MEKKKLIPIGVLLIGILVLAILWKNIFMSSSNTEETQGFAAYNTENGTLYSKDKGENSIITIESGVEATRRMAEENTGKTDDADNADSVDAINDDAAENNVSEEIIIEDVYNLDTYMQRFWEGNVVYNESVLPMEDADGTVEPISLMYAIDEIISVRDATLETEYVYGQDYILEDGKLVITENSNIPTVAYTSMYNNVTDGSANWQPCKNGGYTYYSEGDYFHRKQLAITYTHTDQWTGSIPESKLDLLPNTARKLESQEPLSIVFFGDSITVGANASGFSDVNCPPYMPIWTDMTVEALKKAYNYSEITAVNTAVGGTRSSWGAETAYNNVARYEPDLVVIAFGMNDGTRSVSAESYILNIKSIMDTARTANPDVEFILVSPILANPDTYFNGTQSKYLPALLELETEGTCVADLTSIHTYLLQKKIYSDMTGNNVNHPNDFLIRFYAQVLEATLTK